MVQIEQFSTLELPPDQRLSFWNSLCERTLPGTRVDSAALGFRARMVRWSLGSMTLLRPQSDASRVWRKQCSTAASHRLILHLLNRGEGHFTSAGRDVIVRSGEFILSSPYFGYEVRLSQDHELLVVEMPTPCVAERFPQIETRLNRCLGKTVATRLLQDFLLSMWRHGEYADDLSNWPEEASNAFYDLLSMALRHAAQPGQTDTHGLHQAMLRRAQQFIDDHLSETNLGTASIADHLNVSMRTVQHIFSLACTTPTAYIQERRLSRAADWLRSDPNASVTQVALDLGFQDSAYFSRCFRRKYGVPPRAWRQ